MFKKIVDWVINGFLALVGIMNIFFIFSPVSDTFTKKFTLGLTGIMFLIASVIFTRYTLIVSREEGKEKDQ